jgi:hypothetical protein
VAGDTPLFAERLCEPPAMLSQPFFLKQLATIFFAPDSGQLRLRPGRQPQLVGNKRPRHIDPVVSRENIGVYAPWIRGEWTANLSEIDQESVVDGP